jgi:hypothetical protein
MKPTDGKTQVKLDVVHFDYAELKYFFQFSEFKQFA